MKGLINKGFSFEGIQFTDVKFEGPRINGRPDLTVFARENGKEIPILVIETKRRVPWADPFSPEVIAQAEKYATWLGAPLFATCNENVFVLFETFKEGVPLPQRKLKDYKVSLDENFAKRILEEVSKFRTGVGRWLPLDDVFVQRLRSFHRVITPYIRRALIEKLRYDISFKRRYIRWLKSQLFEYSDEVNERIVEQIAYLLMNRVAFYKTLEAYVADLPELTTIEAEDGREFSKRLRGYFDRVLDVDYEPIFKESIFDEIQILTPLMHAFNDFIEELRSYNLAKVQSDVLGRVYEELIPEDERHKLGQYYTPPPIAEFMVKMCIRSSNDKVLDPGCGSGGFLVKAYHKLKDWKMKENPFSVDTQLHKELLDQLYGIDINQFPAQLAAMNLATRNLKIKSENMHLIVSDFFKVDPSIPIFPSSMFDAVLTNPPYTDWREMEHREKVRTVALKYTDETTLNVGRQAGIYVYFFTHGAKFLRNGGMMGFLVSDAWLDMYYGVGLKKFFMDFFNIKAIVAHDRGVFEKALVNTVVTILEKAEGDSRKKIRDNNIVKFFRIKTPLNIDIIIKTLSEISVPYEDEKIRIVPIKQKDLDPKGKWGVYLRAPFIYFKILEHPKITRLRHLATTKIGLQTFADRFYILNKKDAQLWGIEKEYLKPIITSPREIKRLVMESESEADAYVLVVHDDKNALQGKNVLKYIEHGENVEVKIRKKGFTVKGYHNQPRIKSARRKPWYNLGQVEPASILFPYMMWKRTFFVWNKANVIGHQNFIEIRPKEERIQVALLAVLNSSLATLTFGSLAHIYGGGVAKLTPNDVKNAPVLNVNELTDGEKKTIEDLFLKLCEYQRVGNEKAKEKALKELDNAIFDVLGLTEMERKQVCEGLESLRQMRFQRKEVEVLIETAEGWKPRRKLERKRGVREREPSKRLDQWIQD